MSNANFAYNCRNFQETYFDMPQPKNIKKRVVVKFENLTPELQDEVKKKYPGGFTDHMIRVDKGPGDFFYGVVYETDDTSYFVKINVNIDDNVEEEEDKDYYSDDIKGAEEIADTADDGDDE